MTTNGLKINVPAIAEGLYKIICENGQDNIVAFGMLPAEVMGSLETMLREKIIALAATQREMTIAEFTPFVDENEVKKIMRPIVHEITVGIYSAAQRAGKMVV